MLHAAADSEDRALEDLEPDDLPARAGRADSRCSFHSRSASDGDVEQASRPRPSTGSRRARRRTAASRRNGRCSLSRRRRVAHDAAARRRRPRPSPSRATAGQLAQRRSSPDPIPAHRPARRRRRDAAVCGHVRRRRMRAPCRRIGDDRRRQRSTGATRSSRWTTSRSYAAPELAGQSRVDRPSSAGQLVGVVVDQPAGHRHARRRRRRSTGSPAANVAVDRR